MTIDQALEPFGLDRHEHYRHQQYHRREFSSPNRDFRLYICTKMRCVRDERSGRHQYKYTVRCNIRVTTSAGVVSGQGHSDSKHEWTAVSKAARRVLRKINHLGIKVNWREVLEAIG